MSILVLPDTDTHRMECYTCVTNWELSWKMRCDKLPCENV